MYIYIYTSIYLYTCIHIYVYIHLYIYLYVYTHSHTHTHTQTTKLVSTVLNTHLEEGEKRLQQTNKNIPLRHIPSGTNCKTLQHTATHYQN